MLIWPANSEPDILPVRRMISTVLRPSAVNRMMMHGAPDVFLRAVTLGHHRFKASASEAWACTGDRFGSTAAVRSAFGERPVSRRYRTGLPKIGDAANVARAAA